MSELRFNVLTDPWIPLDVDGRAQHVSYVGLLTGERDSADLVHPRDDLRFYARMLLSALTQALFPAKNGKELRQRIAEPLSREVVEARIESVKSDFELLGKGAFLQEDLSEEEISKAKPGALQGNNTASLVLDWPRKSRHVLFRPVGDCNALCTACATLALYGIQAFAMEDGKSGFGLRGNSPGVRGAPATTTLVALASVRQSIWANTLHEEYRQHYAYPLDAERPWNQARISKPEGAPFGLLEGLFWQPRALHFESVPNGDCDLCGAIGPRVAARAFRSKSQAKFGAFYRHPYTPVIEDSKRRSMKPLRLAGSRPAWTGLADLLAPVSQSKNDVVRPLRAPVVDQWVNSFRNDNASMLVLDIGTTRDDRATPAWRFVEMFPLSSRITDFDTINYIRSLIARAEEVLRMLERALLSVRQRPSPNQKGKGSKAKGYWLPDANAAFWQHTEGPFWSAFDAYLAEDADEDARFADSLRRTAFAIFDEHTSGSASDPQWLAHIVRARRGLAQGLARVLGGHEQGSERKEPADAIA